MIRHGAARIVQYYRIVSRQPCAPNSRIRSRYSVQSVSCAKQRSSGETGRCAPLHRRQLRAAICDCPSGWHGSPDESRALSLLRRRVRPSRRRTCGQRLAADRALSTAIQASLSLNLLPRSGSRASPRSRLALFRAPMPKRRLRARKLASALHQQSSCAPARDSVTSADLQAPSRCSAAAAAAVAAGPAAF